MEISQKRMIDTLKYALDYLEEIDELLNFTNKKKINWRIKELKFFDISKITIIKIKENGYIINEEEED